MRAKRTCRCSFSFLCFSSSFTLSFAPSFAPAATELSTEARGARVSREKERRAIIIRAARSEGAPSSFPPSRDMPYYKTLASSASAADRCGRLKIHICRRSLELEEFRESGRFLSTGTGITYSSRSFSLIRRASARAWPYEI
jgi:hypothetical protein